MVNKKCPLCNSGAKYKRLSFGVSTGYYSCDKCLNFIITPEAEKFIINSSNNCRSDVMNKSKKAKVGEALYIWLEGNDDTKMLKLDYKKEPE